MLAGDAGRPVISSGTLKAVAIPLPTPAEQALLADTLDMTTTKLSKKAQQALAILKAGGTYETGLRRNYFGGETQMYWVESHPGVKVKGFGYITFRELDDAGLLKQDYDVNYGSTCHRRYYAA